MPHRLANLKFTCLLKGDLSVRKTTQSDGWLVIILTLSPVLITQNPRLVQSPVGVALGASGGHVLATGLAVFGGSFLSQYISEKQVSMDPRHSLALRLLPAYIRRCFPGVLRVLCGLKCSTPSESRLLMVLALHTTIPSYFRVTLSRSSLQVGYVGGILFLVFAVATLMGIF